MITLKNQLVLQFSLGQFTDFIAVDDFISMQIVEHTGGLRPLLKLGFILNDKKIIPFINQGNIITIRYGIKELSNDSMRFEIQGDTNTNEATVGSQINLTAAYYNNKFTNLIKCRNIKGKSFEVLKEIVTKDGLKFISNVTRCNDNQVWEQNGKTDWMICKYIVDRAWKDDTTFFSYGFDCNNFYFYDVKDLLQAPPKWCLSCNRSGQSENSAIVNIGTYQVDDTLQGQMSNLAGKNINNICYNIDTGEFYQPKHKLKSFTTLGTNNLNINASDCKNYTYSITSGRDHANSIVALNQNTRNNVLFSSFTVRTTVPGQYRDFRLLDKVQLIPGNEDRQAEGFYLISGIVRQYADGVYRTNLTLNRESANNLMGNLEQGEK